MDYVKIGGKSYDVIVTNIERNFEILQSSNAGATLAPGARETLDPLGTKIGHRITFKRKKGYEKEFFDVGENSADEFEDGFMEQLQTVIKNIKRTISSAFSGITPDANYGVGGYSINVPALARGSVLPGGKPFLAIVNDQPKGQTNIEAPLETIVEAMNIALRSNETEQNININFGGTMGQFIRMLQPEIEKEKSRRGIQLVTGGSY